MRSANVALTAILAAGLVLTPVPANAQPEYAGYLFTYFTGEGTADGEQVYFALSRGNDPLSWRELNVGEPVLTSTLGTAGVRDPHIIRSPEGDRFYLIATDLKINGNGDWDGAQRRGSKSIVVWESTDLVTWTDQRLVRVSPDTAGNTWAPEAFYDQELGAYVVFWASKLYAEDDPNHTGSSYNRMMYATTQDFRSFSEPRVWHDPGYSVIDSTVTRVGDTYYRFTKDERSNAPDSPCGKFITAETSTDLRDTGWDFLTECIGQGAINQGEGPLIFKSNTEDKWYLFIDEFGGRGYVPFESTDLSTGEWTPSPEFALPASPRHGTVLPVTAEEYERLLQAYAPDQLPAGNPERVLVRTGAGQPPVLPATVVASYADGVRRPAVVRWDPVPAAAYAEAGWFQVSGTLVDDPEIQATATVLVTQRPFDDSDLLLRYRFDEAGGAVARDSSGHGYHGTYQRSPAWGSGVDGGSYAMTGGPDSTYVSIPPGLLDGLDEVTVSVWVQWTTATTVNQWVYGLGPDNFRYLFTSPRNGGRVLYSAITTGSWPAESRMAAGAALPGGWQHVAVTVGGGTATMYLNGTAVATGTGAVDPMALHNPASGHSGYIGRSLYPADPYFAGAVDEFRVYGTALPPSEITALADRSPGG